MSSSTSYTIQLLSTISTYLYQYAGIFLCVVGNLGNIFTLCILLRKAWRKNVCVFYFSVCLISNTFLINSSLIAAIAINGFDINVLSSSAVLCKLYIYSTYLFSIYYPIILSLASIDRLLISSQNVDTRLYSSKRLAYFSIGISTFIWAAFCLHILIKAGIQELYPGYVVCYYDPSAAYLNFVSYSVLLTTAILFILVTVLSILTFKNVRHIRQVPRHQRQQIRTMTKKDFQLLRSLYVHNIGYIVFSIAIVGSICFDTTLIYRTPSQFERALQPILSNITGLIHNIPYSSSFFIFVGVSKAFRQEAKRIVYKIFGEDVRTIQDAEKDQRQTNNPTH